MKSAAMRMSLRTKKWLVAVGYVIAAVWVLCPPVYLAASGESPRILGLPFSVFWMLADAFLVFALIWGLWWVEDVRGELEVFESEEASR